MRALSPRNFLAVPHLPSLARALAPLLLPCLLAGCASLPATVERNVSHAYADTAQTRIGRAVAPLAAPHPGLTGVRTLVDGREAFAARYALALGAERSIDVQTYIWHDDTSGSLLAHALWEAAERGVRVRLLLDDANTSGKDPLLAALDAHPRIEVRLFNPFANRNWRLADLALDFGRVHRRMHNKSFTADNQATVVGGRNVGDEYMGAETSVAFADLDLLAVGAAVPQVSTIFDTFWNSESAYPVAALLAPGAAASLEETRAAWQQRLARPSARRYLEGVRQLALLEQMRDRTLALDWVPARVLSDLPSKVLLPADREDVQMSPLLEEALGQPQGELMLVSPYFVPGEKGTQALLAMAARGVRVAVLTNSLAATDVGVVYSGYMRYRRELLRGGVRIYELKPAAEPAVAPDEEEDRERARGIGGSRGGSSSASLHAKTFGVDRTRIFVGSFNLDPRSARLNTEMGMVLESPALAGRLSDAFAGPVQRVAYEVRLEGDELAWIERTPQGEVRHGRTPGVGVLRSLWIGFVSLLPIEWLL